MLNVRIDVSIIIRNTFTLFLLTLNMETSRTISSVLENCQKGPKNFVLT